MRRRPARPQKLHFVPPGLLRVRVLGGEPADVFASANLERPAAIAAGRGGDVRPFGRNTLCGLAQPDVDLGRFPVDL